MDIPPRRSVTDLNSGMRHLSLAHGTPSKARARARARRACHAGGGAPRTCVRRSCVFASPARGVLRGGAQGAAVAGFTRKARKSMPLLDAGVQPKGALPSLGQTGAHSPGDLDLTEVRAARTVARRGALCAQLERTTRDARVRVVEDPGGRWAGGRDGCESASGDFVARRACGAAHRRAPEAPSVDASGREGGIARCTCVDASRRGMWHFCCGRAARA